MQPGKYNFKARQGASFYRTLTWKDGAAAKDITGYTGRMQVRKNVNDPTAVIALEFVSDTSQGISIPTGTDGVVGIRINASTMSAVSAGTYVYDLELTNSTGFVTPLLEGKFIVSPEVTR